VRQRRLWVGENSPIPNFADCGPTCSTRSSGCGIPVLRWPGGCFADDYHWEDGIGPRKDRPRRVNTCWGMDVETCLRDARVPYCFAGTWGASRSWLWNVGTGSPREMRDWVEYLQLANDSTLAGGGAQNGSPQPFGVRYWGVGNEAWAAAELLPRRLWRAGTSASPPTSAISPARRFF